MFARLLTTTLAGCTLACCLTGCSALSLTTLMGPKIDFADAKHPATDIICMWEPGEGKTPDGKPARGFNGTILFFGRANTAPIGVHGQLTFYVYDDHGPRETWSEPIAEFSFTAEEWNQFFKMGALGPSYRIFIPYTRTHPYQVKTSLWVKFEPADGNQEFYSTRSQIVLPGPLMEDDKNQLLELTETRDRTPEKLQNIVTESFSEDAKSHKQDSRIQTLHSWETGAYAPQVQLTNYEVTQGEPAGVNAGLFESAPGAAAESWGSTPPALLPTTDTSSNPSAPRKRFKLGAPE